jgi:hypothetical protein
MLTPHTAGEWVRFLESRDSDEAAHRLGRLTLQLDQALDEIITVLRSLAGSPAHDLEELLRVSRTAINEAVETMRFIVAGLRTTELDLQ